MSVPLVGQVGGTTLRYLEYIGSLAIQIKDSVYALGRALPLFGSRNRWRMAVRQTLAIGVDAFPMVAIMALCTGFILAMQGASELRRFGAVQFVVDLVTIGFTREAPRSSRVGNGLIFRIILRLKET